jgi:Cof subfamily protein (haloacid dehalogenase superfamily)
VRVGHTGVVADLTLYVTDLDGTLLGPDARVSDFTANTLERLMDDGVLITCATARSWVTAQRVLGGLRFRLPVVLYNGTFTYDVANDLLLDEHVLPESTVRSIVDSCREIGIPPLLYGMNGTQEQVSWVSGESNEGMRRFWADRPLDPRNSPRASWDELPAKAVFNVGAIGAMDDVHLLAAAIRARTKNTCVVNVQQDTYHPEDTWLDIVPANVSKAAAIAELALALGATRLVVFGDNLNDLPMFVIADECYAVSNAASAVRTAATAIIGSNSEDGVARWLALNA